MTIDFETSRIRRDWIVLSGISLRCVFGLYDWEQRSAQALVVEVAMALDLDGAAGGDLSASVDYAAVLNQIGFIAVCGKWRLLESMARSEEHTSELQSPDHLVCRLLLEKKKNDYK